MFAQAITPQGDVRLAVRVGCSRPCANMVPEEWPSRIACASSGALQNPAYRPADALKNEGFGVTRRTLRHLANYATIFSSNAISASGAVTFGEWLASIA